LLLGVLLLLLLCGPGLLLLLLGVLLLLRCGSGLLLLLLGMLLLLLLCGPGLLLLVLGVLLLLLCGPGLLLLVLGVLLLLLCGSGLLFVLVLLLLCTDRSSGSEKQEQHRRSHFGHWNTFHVGHLPLNRSAFHWPSGSSAAKRRAGTPLPCRRMSSRWSCVLSTPEVSDATTETEPDASQEWPAIQLNGVPQLPRRQPRPWSGAPSHPGGSAENRSYRALARSSSTH